MEITRGDNAEFLNKSWIEGKSKSALRMTFEAEAKIIQQRIGDLEAVRNRLGLSARKTCQLLMVDPSAWNRWTTGKTKVPPHIYRTLELYLLIHEKHPGIGHQIFMPLGTNGMTLKKPIGTELEFSKKGTDDHALDTAKTLKMVIILLTAGLAMSFFFIFQLLTIKNL